ncbi:MAG: exported protein of unknown function [Moraxellaceae bacterium]|jgi:hypothetical protein|nr:exported protein of unknown function [Moraxellaceae bacterium]
MKRRSIAAGGAVLACLFAVSGCTKPEEVPEDWKRLVKTEGQHFPIPESWISTPEGRIAHSLRLPDSVPKPVPFDFEEAEGPWYKPSSKRDVAIKYFLHLCKTEAGEWTSRTVDKVEGVYFARPENAPGDDFLGSIYAPEAPWIQRNFQLMGESADNRGGYFVRPPFRMYKFVEEPKRDVKWQRNLDGDYVRIFGYTSGFFVKPGHVVEALNELTPMQAIGVEQPTAQFALSWRGIKRPRDRDLRVAGGEMIIYDRFSKEVISVSRTFQLASKDGYEKYDAAWMVAPVCRENLKVVGGLPFSDYVQRVLKDK